MTTETQTTQAATTPEGQASSQQATQTATAADAGGQQQQATEGQGTQGAQTTDGQQGAGDAPAGTETDGGQAAPAGAPDKYEFKAPEGREFDAQVIEQFSEVAKELNLPQDAAQKVIDKIAPALAAKQTRVLQEAVVAWTATSKADSEIGGDKFDENLAVANKALAEFGTPELRTLLDQSGLANHPEIIRWAYRAGKAISEDRVVTGGNGQTAPQSVAQRMYPNMNP